MKKRKRKSSFYRIKNGKEGDIIRIIEAMEAMDSKLEATHKPIKPNYIASAPPFYFTSCIWHVKFECIVFSVKCLNVMKIIKDN